jgi:hypothetical protein
MLQDYINENYSQSNYGIREDIVLYNPKKGSQYIEKLQKHSDLNFIPLSGLSIEGMIQMLNKAKIYIDLGNHPGMDRIPREAALCGCICLFGDQGSVSNSRDVRVLDYYKIDLRHDFENECLGRIQDIFINYDKHYLNQADYRKYITAQRDIFEKQVVTLPNILLK